jgi:hypothetical protein
MCGCAPRVCTAIDLFVIEPASVSLGLRRLPIRSGGSDLSMLVTLTIGNSEGP